MKDDDIEYGFSMAKGLGVKGITTSTTLTMAKRIAPIADKHKLLVGYHGHDATNDPNQTATLESYDTLMAYGKYNGVNLDIGHFTAAGYDAVAFIKKHHAKITNLHVKDRKKDHGPNVAVWGTGDTPIKEVLQLLKKEKYALPGQSGVGIPDSRRIPTSSPRRRSASPTSRAVWRNLGSLLTGCGVGSTPTPIAALSDVTKYVYDMIFARRRRRDNGPRRERHYRTPYCLERRRSTGV